MLKERRFLQPAATSVIFFQRFLLLHSQVLCTALQQPFRHNDGKTLLLAALILLLLEEKDSF